jgi:hypothetical protein
VDKYRGERIEMLKRFIDSDQFFKKAPLFIAWTSGLVGSLVISAGLKEQFGLMPIFAAMSAVIFIVAWNAPE